MALCLAERKMQLEVCAYSFGRIGRHSFCYCSTVTNAEDRSSSVNRDKCLLSVI